MARRAKKAGGGRWVLAAAILVLGAFGGALFFAGNEGAPFRNTPELEVDAYLENSNSLRGNVYRVEGEVLNLLAWSPASGRLIAVGAGEEVLPVLVTPDFNHLNVQRGQKFIFQVEVDERGILRTKELTKS